MAKKAPMNSQSSCELPTIDQKRAESRKRWKNYSYTNVFVFCSLSCDCSCQKCLSHSSQRISLSMIWLFHSPGTFHPTASAYNEQWNHFYSMKLCGEQKNILTIPKIIWHLSIYVRAKKQLQCCKLRPNAIAPFFLCHALFCNFLSVASSSVSL